jgi:hypothetical protein
LEKAAKERDTVKQAGEQDIIKEAEEKEEKVVTVPKTRSIRKRK